MRIRKRTPARAASPGPPPPSPPLPPLQQPMERPREEDQEEEKRAILAAGVRDGGEGDDQLRPPAAAAGSGSSGNSRSRSATDDVPKPKPEPEPEPEPQDDAAASARCSRNDGKRWRCKKAAVPGYLFCDRHIAWSTRKRKPRARARSKPNKTHGCGALILGPTTVAKDCLAAEGHDDEAQRDAGFFGAGF